MAAPYPTDGTLVVGVSVIQRGPRCGIIAAVGAVSDRDLAIRFPSGDDAVLRDVYARFGGAVYTVALSILGDPGRAADVVQSTFVNAWQAAGRFNPDQELAPWLYTIARRQAIDAYRRERHTRPSGATGSDEAEAAVSLEATWEAWQVRIALEQLPEDERQVVRLSWFDGLAHPEIADKLGIPVGTVKSRSHRAHRRLAELLAHVRDPVERSAGDTAAENRSVSSDVVKGEPRRHHQGDRP
jgi:RNA polymerase sigma-70 factor, ECF subfamily